VMVAILARDEKTCRMSVAERFMMPVVIVSRGLRHTDAHMVYREIIREPHDFRLPYRAIIIGPGRIPS
jgi:hypothetical protein